MRFDTRQFHCHYLCHVRRLSTSYSVLRMWWPMWWRSLGAAQMPDRYSSSYSYCKRLHCLSRWLSGLNHWIGHNACWPDGLMTFAGLGSDPGLEGSLFSSIWLVGMIWAVLTGTLNLFQSNLHCLPIRERTNYKLALLTYKAQTTSVPEYPLPVRRITKNKF